MLYTYKGFNNVGCVRNVLCFLLRVFQDGFMECMYTGNVNDNNVSKDDGFDANKFF